MSILLNLDPDVEERLVAEAHRQGVGPEAIAEQIIASSFSSPGRPNSVALQEWDRLADELADLVGPEAPPRTAYAVSRPGIYADHD